MKIHFSLQWSAAFLGLALLGAGCTQAQEPYAATAPSVQPAQQPGTSSWATSTPIKDNQKLAELYTKWAIQSDAPAEIENLRSDCFGVENGRTYGGDLISTLIVDERRRKGWDLDVYTPDYLQNMDRVMAYFTKKKYGKNFFAYSVCHLGKNLDVASGYVSESGVNEDNVRDMRAIKQIALLRNGEVAYELEGVDLFNNTATGATVLPCSATLTTTKAGRTLIWSCFKGMHKVSDGVVSGSDMKEWTFTLEGKFVDVGERVER